MPKAELQHTLAYLREYIIENDLDVGARLPAERHFTNVLSITRNALRKALDSLEATGEISRRVGSGTFVATRSLSPDHNDPFVKNVVEKMSAIQMMRARLTIEPSIAQEAALSATREDISDLSYILACMHGASSWDEYTLLDHRFHRKIAEAADNPLLLSVFDQVSQVHKAVGWNRADSNNAALTTRPQGFYEHRDIADAIFERDQAAAYDAMRAHIRAVTKRTYIEEREKN